MKKREYEEIVNNICPDCNKYISPEHIDAIELTNGMIFKPVWTDNRISRDNKKIYFLYGKQKPYGGRLPTWFSFSYDRRSIRFPEQIIVNTGGYGEFRIPKVNDIIVYSKNGKTISKSVITYVKITSNLTIIEVATPLHGELGGLLSFYDQNEYEPDLCMHGSIYCGLYLKFIPHNNKKYNYKISRRKIKNIFFRKDDKNDN